MAADSAVRPRLIVSEPRQICGWRQRPNADQYFMLLLFIVLLYKFGSSHLSVDGNTQSGTNTRSTRRPEYCTTHRGLHRQSTRHTEYYYIQSRRQNVGDYILYSMEVSACLSFLSLFTYGEQDRVSVCVSLSKIMLNVIFLHNPFFVFIDRWTTDNLKFSK